MFWRNPKRVATQFLRTLAGNDADAAAAFFADDIRFTDSVGEFLVGKEPCRAALERFFDLGMQFTVEVEKISLTGENVLVKGRTRSRDPRMNAEYLWRIKVQGDKIVEYQTHRRHDPPSLIRILTQEAMAGPAGS